MSKQDLVVGICPHDITHDPDKWTEFTDYLLKKLQIQGDFQKYFSFETFAQQFNRMNLIYAHPLHAVQLKHQFDFRPIAKYANKFDEAVVISLKSNSYQGINAISGKKVALAFGSPSHAALLIDLNHNNKSIHFEAINKSSYPEIAVTVATGQAPFGVILKEVWDNLQFQYPGLTTIYTTYTRELVHVFMLSNKLAQHEHKLLEIMLNMKMDPTGAAILKRLNCQGMELFSQQDLFKLEENLKVCHF